MKILLIIFFTGFTFANSIDDDIVANLDFFQHYELISDNVANFIQDISEDNEPVKIDLKKTQSQTKDIKMERIQ